MESGKYITFADRTINLTNMNRRDFLRNSALLAAGAALGTHPQNSQAAVPAPVADGEPKGEGKLITSCPMLQNYAATSMGVAFSVSDMANGYVTYSTHADLSDARTVKCGGYRVTDMNDQVMLVRLTGLKPSTRYYYRIGADRIEYKGGYGMKILGNEEDSRIYSFVTAGKRAAARFCVINDTHGDWPAIEAMLDKVAELAPSCVVWNGDACNVEETIEAQKRIFLEPDIKRRDYASEIPYLFCCGNHDMRGLANRRLERVWMYRQPEERKSRDWDLGRNFAVRMGDIALIGLDTAEDKLDTNPLFAGLFTSTPYREAQVAWLEDALKRPEIARAPYLVAFCHIPLFDPDPKANPGDLAPADKHPDYRSDFAAWQRTCANLWSPALQRAGCQLVITGHQHCYRFDAPVADRTWAQIVGGGHSMTENSRSYPTVIEGAVENGQLAVRVFNVRDGVLAGTHLFAPRKVKARRRKRNE